MKLTAIFLFTACLQVAARTEGQTVSLSLKNAPMKQVFREIQKQTGLNVLVDESLLEKTGKVTLKVRNVSVDEALELCLRNEPLIFAIEGGAIVIKTKPIAVVQPEENLPPPPSPINIQGTITDEKGQALAGVSITVKGTKRGTTTNSEGSFFIDSNPGEILEISSIGYKSQEVKVGGNTRISIILELVSGSLDEFVVTALGIKKEKRSLAYSVSDLKGDELSAGKEANVANELSAKVSGVQVSRAASGAGGSSKVIIRGNNSLQGNSQPLYVIDGIPMNNNNNSNASSTGGIDYGDGISNINSDDIETISVLKGPNAAALYGQQGSNGVILITTKSGKSRKDVGVKFSTDYSIGTALVLPDFQDEYGQGLNGNFTHFRNSANNTIYTMAQAIAAGYQGVPKVSGGRDRLTRGSWGAPMDGREYEDQWGNLLKLTPQTNT